MLKITLVSLDPINSSTEAVVDTSGVFRKHNRQEAMSQHSSSESHFSFIRCSFFQPQTFRHVLSCSSGCVIIPLLSSFFIFKSM